MNQIINFFTKHYFLLITSASCFLGACLLVLASLSYSADINKRAFLVKRELTGKELGLASFVTNTFAASHISDKSPLDCKELIKAKFAIIKAMNSAITQIPNEARDKLLNFEDEIFKDKNACSKDLYDQAALKRISDKIVLELRKDIRSDKQRLKRLTSSLFYTNQN